MNISIMNGVAGFHIQIIKKKNPKKPKTDNLEGNLNFLVK